MYSSTKSKRELWLSSLAVVIWLLYLALAIRHHATLSEQPPVFDALGYFLKGKNFWDALLQQHVFNPSVWPEYRPPGTILMSFPWGYDGVQPFYFRSVFFPIALCAIAAWILPHGKLAKPEPVLWIALTFALTSLPLFYEFEPNFKLPSHVTWGHVDTFFASFAALAAAASLRSLDARSHGWLVVSALAASFSLWVKPAGMAIMALITGIWLVLAVARILVADAGCERDQETRYLWKGMALTLPIYALATAGAAVGGYLSADVLAFFTNAVSLLGALRTPWSIERAQGLLETLIGYPFAALCVAGVAGAAARAFRDKSKRASLNNPALVGMISGLCYLVAGIGWWIMATESTIVRYLFPFLLMFAVTLLPAIEATVARFSWIGYVLVLLLAFGPAANLAALLAAPAPSTSWQRASGVNVSAGAWNWEVEAARKFLDAKTRERSVPVIYTVDSYAGTQVFESELVFAWLMDPTVAKVGFLRAVDWRRTSAYRFEELLGADYLLATPIRGVSLPDSVTTLTSYREEEDVIRVWVSTLSEADGVTIEIDRPNVLLLKVTDHTALRGAFARFSEKLRWRDETVAANQSEWWNADAVSRYANNPAAKEIQFGDVYKVHALSINRTENGLQVEVWWEELRQEEGNDKRFLFLHLVDPSGAIVHRTQIALDAYAPPSPDRRWRYGAATFRNVLPNAKITALAFGIYLPSDPVGGFFTADKGTRDWDNRRVLVTLP